MFLPKADLKFFAVIKEQISTKDKRNLTGVAAFLIRTSVIAFRGKNLSSFVAWWFNSTFNTNHNIQDKCSLISRHH